MTTVELGLPGVAAVLELLCWRIKLISGDGGEYGVFSGEILGRSVVLSFGAKGERILSSPALQGFAGLLAWSATAAVLSDWWFVDRWCGSSPLPFVSWGWLMRVQWNQSIVDGPRCRVLQQCPRYWSPLTWRKEDLAGLQAPEVAGVEVEDGHTAGCVRISHLYWGVSCKKAGVYCMLV
ncbi:unnamed protein product [Urochloa humidicola]